MCWEAPYFSSTAFPEGPLASRVAQGVSGPSSSCVWNPRVFADDARGWQCPFVLCLHPQGCPGLEARFPARRREERGCGPVTGKDRASCPAGLNPRDVHVIARCGLSFIAYPGEQSGVLSPNSTSPGESGLVSRGSQGLRSPLESSRHLPTSPAPRQSGQTGAQDTVHGSQRAGCD